MYYLTPLLQEGGVPNGRGGRLLRYIVYSYFMFSPTTSPFGDSSFLKEESF